MGKKKGGGGKGKEIKLQCFPTEPLQLQRIKIEASLNTSQKQTTSHHPDI